jgi:hypothetical protein
MRSVSVELDSQWIKPVSIPARTPEALIKEQTVLATVRTANANRSW